MDKAQGLLKSIEKLTKTIEELKVLRKELAIVLTHVTDSFSMTCRCSKHGEFEEPINSSQYLAMIEGGEQRAEVIEMLDTQCPKCADEHAEEMAEEYSIHPDDFLESDWDYEY